MNINNIIIVENMKRLFLILILLIAVVKGIKCQNVYTSDSLINCVTDSVLQDSISFSPKDSLYLDYISDVVEEIVENVRNTQPRYKMYKTENLYNLIELDTATGKLWLVQFGMNNKSSRMKYAIDDTSLLWDWEDIVPGRYELYPTNNIFTFILLDTKWGSTYQVQWNTKEEKRFRISIR